MGILTRLAKAKAYWGLLTGLFTLVIIPVARWFFRRKKETPKKGVIDAEFTEVKE